MKIPVLRISGVALVLGLFWSFQASAASFTQFVAFGDSTLDSGWWKGALANQCAGYVTPSCDTGNFFTNGRIATAISKGGTGAPVGVGQNYAELVAQYYGLTALP